MLRSFRALLASGLACLAAPVYAEVEHELPAHYSPEFIADANAFNARLVETLVARGGGDVLVFAAHVLANLRSDEARPAIDATPESLVQDAMSLIDDDVTALWRLLGSCDSFDEACDRASVLERLRALDPDNVWSWLHGLDQAADDEAFDAALSQAAQADRSSHHHLALWQRNAQALGQVPLTPAMLSTIEDPAYGLTVDDYIFVYAMSLDTMHRLPRHPSALRQRCMAAEPGSARRAWCVDIARTLRARSDNMSDAMDGARLELHLADDPATRAQVELDCRSLRWLYSANSEAQRAIDTVPGGMSLYRELLLREGATEIAAMREFNAARGMSAEPPETFAMPPECTQRIDELAH